MTRVLSVVSGKGGAGKTTFSTNLAATLSDMGKEVALIDGDFAGANVTRHFGIDSHSATLNDVVNGDAYITQAVFNHESGVSVLPADLEDYSFDSNHLKHVIMEFMGTKDFVIIDSPPGANKPVESALEASHEILIVLEPLTTSLDNAKIMKEMADDMGVGVAGVVVNKVFEDEVELSESFISEMLEADILGRLPHSKHVRESLMIGKPLKMFKPYSKVSKNVEDIACHVAGEDKIERNVFSELRDGFLRLID